MNLKTLLWQSPGTQVSHHKETANLPTEQLPVPEKIILPMRQHVGAACEVRVQKGDRVLVGLGGRGLPHRREGAAQEPLGDRHPAHQRS